MEPQETHTPGPIAASCPLFVCRSCRTKTGWRHQRWCEHTELLTPGCADCRYWEAKRERCGHPSRRKVGDGE